MGIPNGENCLGNAFCRHIIVLILGIYIAVECHSVEKKTVLGNIIYNFLLSLWR